MSSSGPRPHDSTEDENSAGVIAIIGGSGLHVFPELTVIGRELPMTAFGLPSDQIIVGEYDGRKVLFLPRHGSAHSLAPHQIPYKANLAALRLLGARHVLASCIAGSLKQKISPGSFVVPDQFVNL